MKVKEFKALLNACVTAESAQADVWFKGWAFLNLTERQVEEMRQALKASFICKVDFNGNVLLPSGIVLKKLTNDYAIYVSGHFHHTFNAWNDEEAFQYLRKKSKLYGEYQTTLYKVLNNDIELLGECFNGYGFLYKKEGGAK